MPERTLRRKRDCQLAERFNNPEKTVGFPKILTSRLGETVGKTSETADVKLIAGAIKRVHSTTRKIGIDPTGDSGQVKDICKEAEQHAGDKSLLIAGPVLKSMLAHEVQGC